MGEFRLSDHVLGELSGRGIPLEVLLEVLERPQQIVAGARGRRVYQSQVLFPGGKLFLVRAIVDDSGDVPVVVTAYRTSRIRRYWRVP